MTAAALSFAAPIASARPCSALRRKGLCLLALCLLASIPFQAALAQAPASALDAIPANPPLTLSRAAAESSAHMRVVSAPLSFEPAPATLAAEAKHDDPYPANYIAHGPGYHLQLEPSRASIHFSSHDRPGSAATPDASQFSFHFLGANARTKMAGLDRQQATHSFFPTGDRRTWVGNLPTYARVQYTGIYNAVDLSFYGNGSSLEYDFIVKPGATPGVIALALNGARQASVDAAGNLTIHTNQDVLTLLKPVAYQLDKDGTTRRPVEAGYKLKDEAEGPVLSFALGRYDPARTLIIDPVLLYGLGISASPGQTAQPYYYPDGQIGAMTVDSLGNTYVSINSNNDPASSSVLKFNPSGKLLLQASLGSSGVQITAQSIAVNAAGDIYIAGNAGAGLPTTPNAFQTSLSGNSTGGFISVIKADASALLYSSYLASSSSGSIDGLAVDTAGRAFVTGYTSGLDFPTTAGALQPVGSNSYGSQGFVAKLDPALSGQASLLYSTYLSSPGASNYISGNAIAVDGAGNAYVTSSAAPGFPVTSGSYFFAGITSSGAYVSKLDPTGSTLVYSAFLGPGNPSSIVIDGSGAAYVAGSVYSGDFPVTPGAYQTKYPGGFALKLSSDGTRLVYSTFLSGPGGVQSSNVLPTSVTIPPGCASNCLAVVAGITSTSDFPLQLPLQSFPGQFTQVSPGSGLLQQGFAVALSSDGATAYCSTYLGAATSSTLHYGSTPAVAIDRSGDVYFASNIFGSDAPVTLPGIGGGGRGLLLKIGLADAGATVAIPSQIYFSQQVVHSTAASPVALQLRNMGSHAVTLTRPFTFSSKEFAETDTCGTSLPAGGLCTLQLTFQPAAAGLRTGTLSISSTGSPKPLAVSLVGSGIDGSALVLSTTALSFADRVLNSPSAAQTVTLTNTGDQALAISSIYTYLPDYKLTTNCPVLLAGGATCQAVITFSPTQIGLRWDSLEIQIGNSSSSFPNPAVTLTGSGLLAASGQGTLIFSQDAINFDSVVVGAFPEQQTVLLTNSGDTPVTVNSIVVTTTRGAPQNYTLIPLDQGGTAFSCISGVYGLGGQGTFPITLAPQSSCNITVSFAPSAAGQSLGTVTVTDTAIGSPHAIGLSGLGLFTVQALTASPTALSFPAQPLGSPSASQTFVVTNGGQDFVTLDRVYATGDFGLDEAAYSGCEAVTLGPNQTCNVTVLFDPQAIGARAGTLQIIDSASSTPQTFNLSGTGIQATGALQLGQSALTFAAQAVGTSSPSQELVLSNPGNTPVTISNLVATGDFAVTSFGQGFGNYCSAVLAPDSTCQVLLAFSPTRSSGQKSGTLTIHSSVGNSSVSLSGTALASSQAIHLSPTALSFGKILVGSASTSNQLVVYVDNTGSLPVSFPAPPVIAGTGSTPGADFSLQIGNCFSYIPSPFNTSPGSLPAGQGCSFSISLNPSKAAAEQATLNLVDSAGTQTIALTGTGVSTTPPVALQPTVLTFPSQPVGSSNSFFFSNSINFVNNGSTPVVINSEVVTSGSKDFALNSSYPSCAGQTVNPGLQCSSPFNFQTATAGYHTGVVTYTTSAGTYTVALAGYALSAVNNALLTPEALVLPAVAVNAGPASFYNQPSSLVLTNTGNRPLTVGTVSGVNVSTSGDFSTAYPGGSDFCSGQIVNPGTSCSVNVGFSPLTTGVKKASLVFPVTYADQQTAKYTASLTGTGLAGVSSASLLPQATAFPDQAAGVTSQSSQNSKTLTLTNTGTLSLTVGTLSGSDLGQATPANNDFVINSDYCSGQTLAPTHSCNFSVAFLPITAGHKTASATLPVTYFGGGTGSLTTTLTGTGVPQFASLEVNPSGLDFNVEVVGTTDVNNVRNAVLTATGNAAVNLASITASANFTVTPNSCGLTINPGGSCTVSVSFTPLLSTAPGPVKGTLTVIEKASGITHIVNLAGVAIAATQQLALSQTVVSFPGQQVGTSSAYQVVYLTDLGSSATTLYGPPPQIQINSIKLGGPNATDFTEVETCGGSLGFTIGGRQDCLITVAFNPAASSLGTRTASVTITPAQGAPLVIQLIGVGVAPAAAGKR